MTDPWGNVRPGDPQGFRTARHLAAQAQRNQQMRGSAPAVAGLVDNCGPPFWDQRSWDEYHAKTGQWPFSAQELPVSFEDCPVWAYERMGLRPPLMAG